MTCREFLARYSEYLDERVGPLEAERWRSHAMLCRSCARYDQVLRDGLERVRELPDIEPSSDFLPRLQHRLYHLHDDDLESGNRASGGSAAVALAVAAMLTLLAWSPLIRSQVGGSAGAEDDDRPEVRGVEEAEPTAAREVPSLSPSAVVPYGPPMWTDESGDRGRILIGRDVMLDRGLRSQDWRGTVSFSWPQDLGPDYSSAGFGPAGFAAPGFVTDDVSRFFASPDFGSVRFRSRTFGQAAGLGSSRSWSVEVSGPYSPLIIGPPAFVRGDGQWISVPADRGYAPTPR